MAPALILAVVYLIWEPPSADLAAQTFRADLFFEQGFEVWSNAWYGGLHLPGYSLLFPPLAYAPGVRLLGAISVVAAAWLFGRLVRPHFEGSAAPATLLFSLGAATNLFTGRLTFALGVAFALAAVLAMDRERPLPAAVLALLTSLASPVAGLFLAFGGAVLLVAGRPRATLAIVPPSLAGILVLALLFPTGGFHPFAANTFWLIATATVLLVAVVPREHDLIRTGSALYAAFCLAAFLIDTPVGGNATRLGALLAAPLLALGAWGRRPGWLIGLALVPLLYWQLVAPVRDLADAVGEPSVEGAYYEPLLEELDQREPDEPFRVHVPPTRNRWEAVYVADEYPLARGWLRQAESGDFELFQDGNLDAASYRAWLDERGVAFVAVSEGAEPDYLSEDEIALIETGLPYLTEVWSNRDWGLYEVESPKRLAEAPARLTALTDSGFQLEVPSAGEYSVKVRFSRWFDVLAGSAVVRGDGDWTVVEAREQGSIVVEPRFP